MKCSEIAYYLGKECYGLDGEICSFSSLTEIKPGSLVFAKKFDEKILTVLNATPGILAIVTPDYKDKLIISYILSSNPRLDYLKVLEKFFFAKEIKTGIHPTAVVEAGAEIGKGVYIGANCYIGDEVKVGEGTIICPNVIIDGKCVVGKYTYIKSGVVIGQAGFGFERDEDGIPIHFPHVGKVIIGDYVYVGANTAIDRATLENTVIGDYVKIDNLVHIAHNVVVDQGAYIIAGTILGGGVHVGKNCWIAPNVSVKQQLHIGDGALVGLGAVVLKDVEENTVVAGSPAKFLKKI